MKLIKRFSSLLLLVFLLTCVAMPLCYAAATGNLASQAISGSNPGTTATTPTIHDVVTASGTTASNIGGSQTTKLSGTGTMGTTWVSLKIVNEYQA